MARGYRQGRLGEEIRRIISEMLIRDIRSEISHQIKMRHVPELIFKIDKSMEYGRHISNIIDQLEIDHSNDDEGEDR